MSIRVSLDALVAVSTLLENSLIVVSDYFDGGQVIKNFLLVPLTVISYGSLEILELCPTRNRHDIECRVVVVTDPATV